MHFEITDPQELADQVDDLGSSAAIALDKINEAVSVWQDAEDDAVEQLREAASLLRDAVSDLQGPLPIHVLIEAAEDQAQRWEDEANDNDTDEDDDR